MVNVKKPVAGSTPARTVTQNHQKLGRVVREAAQEKVEQSRTGAAACVREGQDKVQQVERSFAQYVREQPLKSLLIAAGVGLLFGRFWMRR
jgi:ElaB/YqjD/DUF883 family membrane-anchored ribosome-binding protein